MYLSCFCTNIIIIHNSASNCLVISFTKIIMFNEYWEYVWLILGQQGKLSGLSEAHINTLRPRQNGRHFPDAIFKWIFYENVWILIKISLKFVPKGPINNIPALVQIMAWRRSGDKPLSEPMMVRLPMHICVSRPQWVKPCHAAHILF